MKHKNNNNKIKIVKDVTDYGHRPDCHKCDKE